MNTSLSNNGAVTIEPIQTKENAINSNNKSCNDYCNYCCTKLDDIVYILFVIMCCPCICCDKSGLCKETNSTQSNNDNDVAFGIAIGMTLNS